MKKYAVPATKSRMIKIPTNPFIDQAFLSLISFILIPPSYHYYIIMISFLPFSVNNKQQISKPYWKFAVYSGCSVQIIKRILFCHYKVIFAVGCNDNISEYSSRINIYIHSV